MDRPGAKLLPRTCLPQNQEIRVAARDSWNVTNGGQEFRTIADQLTHSSNLHWMKTLWLLRLHTSQQSPNAREQVAWGRRQDYEVRNTRGQQFHSLVRMAVL